MDKIAAALQRTLGSEAYGDSLFGSLDQAVPTTSHSVRVPRPIEYHHSRIVKIPPHVLERHRVAVVANDSTADAFRTLRTQLLMEFRKNRWQTLAVTSPNKGAGKSTVALNLAISFAMEVDHTALLVDADLRDPDLRNFSSSTRVQVSPTTWLATRRSRIYSSTPKSGNLALLPGGAPVANTSELMRSPMMANLVHELRSRYPERIIVFDVPAVLSGADTLALSGYMDATILLVEERKTARDDVARACELLQNSNLLGIVLNKSRELPKPDPIKWPKRGFFRRIFGTEG